MALSRLVPQPALQLAVLPLCCLLSCGSAVKQQQRTLRNISDLFLTLEGCVHDRVFG